MKWTLRFASLGTYCFKQEPADSGAGDGGSDAGHPHQPHVEDQGQELRHAVRRPRPGTDPIFITCIFPVQPPSYFINHGSNLMILDPDQ